MKAPNSRAISRTFLAVVVVVVLIIAAVAAIYLITSVPPTTVTATSVLPTTVTATSVLPTTITATSVPPTTSTTTAIAPSGRTFTYETSTPPIYMDPAISYATSDTYLLENVYESLLFYNRSQTTPVLWLAQNYTVSPSLTTINWALRSGITFADGEAVNSTAVYFSYNRLLLFDGSQPTTHGTQSAWLIQELLNHTLSTAESGKAQPYTSQWVNEVLSQDFIQVTGPLTFTMHLQNPTSAWSQLFESTQANIYAPQYVMQHDLALWNQPSTGYKLPYPTLSGNVTTQMYQYFDDIVATCNSGITPSGCGTSYLDGSYQGSLAGSGPYIIKSISSTGDAILQANPNYWGGPYQYNGGKKIVPYFTTLYFNYVPSQLTRELDIESAAKSGQAMTIDFTGSNLYDIVSRETWVTTGTLESVIPGVSVTGPYASFTISWENFGTNVTNMQTGKLYTFQPFADIRFRLAFADAVNISQVNLAANAGLGEAANSIIPPGFAPSGSYNSSLKTLYSYNPDESAILLLDAMEHPITHFTFFNGTVAPPGFFNNTFGCTALSNGVCSSPKYQTIPLDYQTGFTLDESIFEQIASVIDNISSTYNMGLTAVVQPIPPAEFFPYQLSHYYFMSLGSYGADYPWSTDLTTIMYSPGGVYSSAEQWNFTWMSTLFSQLLTADAKGNVTGNVQLTNLMNELANREVMYLWTIYTYQFNVFTSNVQGADYYNPMLLAPYYFAYLS